MKSITASICLHFNKDGLDEEITGCLKKRHHTLHTKNSGILSSGGAFDRVTEGEPVHLLFYVLATV